MNPSFKSIIYFYLYNQRTEELKLAVDKLKGVISFKAYDLEEVKQIIQMSERSCIICDDITNILIAHEEHLKFIKGRYKIFIVDWEEHFSSAELQKLQNRGISFFKGNQLSSVNERLQAYLMGRVSFNSLLTGYTKDENAASTKHFITIIDSKNNSPQILISTHEQFEDINNLIGDSWDDILYDVIESVLQGRQPKEGKLRRGDFYQIVVKTEDADVKRLALVHITVNADLDTNIKKIKTFLSSRLGDLTSHING
jgi:hypothetical protein